MVKQNGLETIQREEDWDLGTNIELNWVDTKSGNYYEFSIEQQWSKNHLRISPMVIRSQSSPITDGSMISVYNSKDNKAIFLCKEATYKLEQDEQNEIVCENPDNPEEKATLILSPTDQGLSFWNFTMSSQYYKRFLQLAKTAIEK